MQCVTSSLKRVILDYSSCRITEFSWFFLLCRVETFEWLVTYISKLFSFILFIALMPTFFTLACSLFRCMDCQTA